MQSYDGMTEIEVQAAYCRACTPEIMR